MLTDEQILADINSEYNLIPAPPSCDCVQCTRAWETCNRLASCVPALLERAQKAEAERDELRGRIKQARKALAAQPFSQSVTHIIDDVLSVLYGAK